MLPLLARPYRLEVLPRWRRHTETTPTTTTTVTTVRTLFHPRRPLPALVAWLAEGRHLERKRNKVRAKEK